MKIKRSSYSPLKGVIVEVDHSEAIQKGCILGGTEAGTKLS